MVGENEKNEPNKVREMRESMLMSKAELARKAGLSALTIDRVEKGNRCRMDTKRKILLALGVKLSERDKVFIEDEEAEVEAENVSAMEYKTQSNTSSSLEAHRQAEVTVSQRFYRSAETNRK